MAQFAVGLILGIAIATVGLSGVAKVADKGVEATKTVIKDVAQ